MKINSRPEDPAGRVAFLWDESFLWGIMACKALTAADLPFELVRSGDIRNGCLDRFTVLFVPGGWASNKAKALGAAGVEQIRRFVEYGGSYLGFCGGAGLATGDGIGLLPITRRPTKDRVPSFSGRIRLGLSRHALWQGVSEPVFHAWWPSQFVLDGGVAVLAAYGEAMPDSFSSDVNVGDAEAAGSWPELERLYRINLDPKRLAGEPAVVEGTFGKGKVLLSLVHFDTPNDRSGATALRNLWTYLGCGQGRRSPLPRPRRDDPVPVVVPDPFLSELEAAVNGVIELGIRNFLWFRKNPMLLQWRRGVRGLEYCTLSVMIGELAGHLRQQPPEREAPDIKDRLEELAALLLPFVDKAKRLLVRERFAMQGEHITYDRCADREIQSLREELFSRSKSHGGLFKELLDRIDGLLYGALIRR